MSTTGRRFSRRVRVKFDSLADLRAWCEHNTGPDRDLPSLIAWNVEAARARLRAAGLPDCDTVELPNGICTIEHYVIKTKGYAEDSPEGLAARIIERAKCLASWQGASRDQALWELAQLVMLSHVYGITTAGAKKSARQPRKRKLPLDLSEQFTKLCEQGKKREAAGILARRYATTEAAVRVRLRAGAKKSTS